MTLTKRNLYIIILILLTISGCSKLDQIKKIVPRGTEFQNHLSELYKNFAESEAENYDWIDSNHFASKSMLLAYGHDVEPEILKNWRIPKSHLKSLYEARKQLVALITEHNIIHHPKLLALAQFSFDCWVEEQEENWQLDAIEEYRENFYNYINILSNKIAEKKPHKKPIHKKEKVKKIENKPIVKKINKKPVKKALKKPLVKIVKKKPLKRQPAKIIQPKKIVKLEDKDFRIKFLEGKNKISDSGNNSLKKIIDKIKNNSKVEIILNCYSEGLKNDDANLALAKDRGLIIKKLLTNAGINKKNINIFAFGGATPEALQNNNPNKIEINLE